MSRIRTREVVVPVGMDVVVDNNTVGGGEPDQVYSFSSPWVSEDAMTDSVSPGYFEKKRSGDYLPLNSMSQAKLEISPLSNDSTSWHYVSPDESQKGLVEVTGSLGLQGLWRWQNRSHSNLLNWLSSYSAGAVPNLKSPSVLGIESLADARLHAMDLGTFAAEFNKTAALILRFRRNVLRRARSIYRANRREILSVGPRVFFESWLEFRYGWRILYYDVVEINQALERLKSEETRLRSRGYATDSAEVTLEDTSSVDPWGWPIKRAPRSTVSSNNRSRIELSGTKSLTFTRRAGSIVDLTVDNVVFIDPLVTAWEVIPFTFIVDWFTNIGDNIAAFSPFALSNHRGTWISERYSIDTLVEVSAEPYQGNPTYDSSVSGTRAGVFVSKAVLYNRYPMEDLGIDLRFPINLDWKKFLDIAAISAVLLGNYRRSLSQTTRL